MEEREEVSVGERGPVLGVELIEACPALMTSEDDDIVR